MSQITPATSFEDDLEGLLSLAVAPVTSPQELTANLVEIYRIANRADIERYDVVAMRPAARHLQQAVAHMRTALRDQVADWRQRGLMSPEAQIALRNSLRAMRYASDMLGELALGFQRMPEGDKTHRAFAGPAEATFTHARLGPGAKVDFRSGDVLLVRGVLHNSAAIARIGEVDSQYSHVALLHVDGRGQASVVEALIEEGAIINTLDTALGHNVGRAMLLRHADAAVAKRAADIMYERVRRSRSGEARHIPYDFSMRLEGTRELFCAKLVRQAYAEASEGRLVLPTFKTRFPARNADLLYRVGIKASESFAPGDMEIEPTFDLVAEWADHRVTGDLRLKDLIVTKLFEWMEQRGWRFQEDVTMRLVGVLGQFAAHFSDGIKEMIADIVPKIPSNMPRRTISTIAMLHKTAEPLFEDLRAAERELIDRVGRPMHAREVFAHLERLREASNGRIGYLVAPK